MSDKFFSDAEVATIRRHYKETVPPAQRLTDAELDTAILVAEKRQLYPPPLGQHIFFMKRKNREQAEDGSWRDAYVLSLQTGIDGFRLIAERTGKYVGSGVPEYEHDQSGFVTRAVVKVEKIAPDGSRASVGADAWFEEYAQYSFRKGAEKSLTKMWAEKGRLMLSKCAELVAHAVPLTDEAAVIDPFVLRVQLLCRQLQALVPTLAQFDAQIAKTFADHPDRQLFVSLPGAGPVLAPRLLASLGTQRERFARAADLQAFTGIAPVTKQSGGKCHVHRRYRCPKFQRRVTMNTPRRVSCTVAGRRPITTSNGPRAPRITPRCGPWASSGSGSSFAAGRTARPTMKY